MPAKLLALFVLLMTPALAQAGGLPPEESLRRFVTPQGFRVELVANEPEIRQPVTMSFDHRGRMWVIQYLQYPNPAGHQRHGASLGSGFLGNCRGKPYLGHPFNQTFVPYFFLSPDFRGLRGLGFVIDWRTAGSLLQNAPLRKKPGARRGTEEATGAPCRTGTRVGIMAAAGRQQQRGEQWNSR